MSCTQTQRRSNWQRLLQRRTAWSWTGCTLTAATPTTAEGWRKFRLWPRKQPAWLCSSWKSMMFIWYWTWGRDGNGKHIGKLKHVLFNLLLDLFLYFFVFLEQFVCASRSVAGADTYCRGLCVNEGSFNTFKKQKIFKCLCTTLQEKRFGSHMHCKTVCDWVQSSSQFDFDHQQHRNLT